MRSLLGGCFVVLTSCRLFAPLLGVRSDAGKRLLGVYSFSPIQLRDPPVHFRLKRFQSRISLCIPLVLFFQ